MECPITGCNCVCNTLDSVSIETQPQLDTTTEVQPARWNNEILIVEINKRLDFKVSLRCDCDKKLAIIKALLSENTLWRILIIL